MNTHSPSALLERFIAKVEFSDSTPCWLWKAYVSPLGYGMIGIGGTVAGAHRVSYALLVGPIPDGLQIDHLCRNRACVNPSHLEPVTQRTNLLRGDTICAANVAKDECSRGHPFTPENTYTRRNRTYPSRECILCRKLKRREYYVTQHQ